MVLLIIAGTVIIIAGVIFLSGEKNVRAVNKSFSDLMNKTIFGLDDTLLKYRICTGICFLLIWIFCIFMAYWIKVMAPSGVKIF